MATETETLKRQKPVASSDQKKKKSAEEEDSISTGYRKKRNAGHEIEEIFEAVKKTKKEEVVRKSKEKDLSAKKEDKHKNKKKKMTKEGRGASVVAGHDEDPAKKQRKRKTADGLAIYSAEELGIGKSDAGGTPLCPFDCSCCF